MTVPPNKLIAQLAPYASSETTIPGISKPIMLAQNELAFSPSPLALAALRDSTGTVTRYPDSDHLVLKRALSETYALDQDRMICGAGSMELMLLVAMSYLSVGDTVVCSRNGYKYFPTLAAMMGATVINAAETNLTANVDNLLEAVYPQTRAVYLANPNNPTGTLLSRSEVTRLAEGLDPSILLILDSAYGEFVTDPNFHMGDELVEQYENVVMLRTFSKIYGLAGLRIGWGYMSTNIINVINRMRPGGSVSDLALATAVAALKDTAHTARIRDQVITLRQEFCEMLGNLGLEAVPSNGNFVLFRVPEQWPLTAAKLFDGLRGHGIILRPMASFGLPDCLQATIGSASEMAALETALEKLSK